MYTIESLLKVIYNYYQIGLGYNIYNSESYKKIKKIVGNKIDDIAEEKPTILNTLIESLNKMGDYLVTDYSYCQEPSYYLSIQLEESKQDSICITRSIYIHISLLDNIYTIFNVLAFYSHSNKGTLIGRSFSFLDNNNDFGFKPYELLKKTIMEEIENLFKEYTYVSHKDLFDVKLTGGMPHNITESTTNTYPIFSFLFGHFCLEKTSVEP